MWEKQVEICRALASHGKVTVRSAHDLGKTFVAACLVLWHLFTFPPENKVLTTAPTMRQVKKLIWGNIASLHRRLEDKLSYAGELLQTELRLGPLHEAVGYSTDDPNSFQGVHAQHLLVIFDEACGISREIYEAAEGVISGKGNRVLLIGNPTEPNTYFHETHTGDIPGFYRIKLSAYDCPNFRIRPDGKYYELDPAPFPGFVSLEWVNRMIKAYGRDDPRVVSRVFGEFPSAAINQLIDDKIIATAIAKGALLRKIIGRTGKGEEVVPSDMFG